MFRHFFYSKFEILYLYHSQNLKREERAAIIEEKKKRVLAEEAEFLEMGGILQQGEKDAVDHAFVTAAKAEARNLVRNEENERELERVTRSGRPY